MNKEQLNQYMIRTIDKNLASGFDHTTIIEYVEGLQSLVDKIQQENKELKSELDNVKAHFDTYVEGEGYLDNMTIEEATEIANAYARKNNSIKSVNKNCVGKVCKLLLEENKELHSRIDKTYKLLIQFCNENQPYLDEIEHCCKTKIEFVSNC